MDAEKGKSLFYVIAVSVSGLLLAALANVVWGSVSLPFHDVLAVLTGKGSSQTSVIVWEYRLPQVLTAVAVGMALSVAGLLLQTVFRNPLAGPSVLGVSAGASFGVALLLLSGPALGLSLLGGNYLLGEMMVVLAALAGAIFVIGIILYISSKIGNVVVVLIIGIMIGYLVSALVGVLQFFSGSEALQAFVVWGLGSFAKNTLPQSLFLLITTILISLFTLRYALPLNAILLGQDYARSLGFGKRSETATIILSAGLLVAIGTAFTGPIAFIGLAVPHLVRSWLGTSDHRKLIPIVMLTGASLALVCNLIARLPGLEISLPVNAVTSALGAPVVIWIIVKRSRIKVS